MYYIIIIKLHMKFGICSDIGSIIMLSIFRSKRLCFALQLQRKCHIINKNEKSVECGLYC